MTFKTFSKQQFRNKLFKRWGIRTRTWHPLAPVLESFEIVDTILTDLINTIGDEAVAKRVRKLQGEYPAATVPELVCMDWLMNARYRWIFQGEAYGGRAALGGLVPDFVVDVGGVDGMAWQIQGSYWHGKDASKRFSDAEGNMRLMGQWVGGIRIGQVVPILDLDIYRRREQVFTLALAGIALPQ